MKLQRAGATGGCQPGEAIRWRSGDLLDSCHGLGDDAWERFRSIGPSNERKTTSNVSRAPGGVKSLVNAMLERSASDRRRVHLRPDSQPDPLVVTQGFIVAGKSLSTNGGALERWGVEPPNEALKSRFLCP